MPSQKTGLAKQFKCPACGAEPGASCTGAYYFNFRRISSNAPTRPHTARLKVMKQFGRCTCGRGGFCQDHQTQCEYYTNANKEKVNV